MILMQNRKQKLYAKVFKYLRDIHQIQPSIVMMDFEKASRNAAKLIWKTASIRGCWFHFCQALRRKAMKIPKLARKLQKDKITKVIVHMFMALALLPLSSIREGLIQIIRFQKKKKLYQSFFSFNRYFMRFWMHNPENFCVHDLPRRTTNYVEGMNSMLKRDIRQHPNIYSFLDSLQTTMDDVLNKYLNEKHQQSSPQDRSKITRKLNFALRCFECGEYDELRFIMFMSGVKVKKIRTI